MGPVYPVLEIHRSLEVAGFAVREIIEREPYAPEVEYRAEGLTSSLGSRCLSGIWVMRTWFRGCSRHRQHVVSGHQQAIVAAHLKNAVRIRHFVECTQKTSQRLS